MLVFVLLVGLFALLHLPPLSRLAFLRSRKDKASVAMALMFMFTGTDHFLHSQRYVAMMPPYLPWPLELVYLSGFFELLGAVGLLIRWVRRWAGYGLALLLLVVFQANVYVAVKGLAVEGLPSSAWYYWVRLPFQFIFIGWALWCSRPELIGSKIVSGGSHA
ncbi:MAG: DoxX family protein [Terriglobia bacterium]